MPLRNPVKAKLKRGETSIGAWIGVSHPDISESLSKVGFDWLLFDMEHAPLSIEQVQLQLQSMGYARDCVPLIRVAWNDIVLIKRALDIGAWGLVIPWVNTREEALNAVRACKYPPEGLRGFGPRRAAQGDPDYVQTVNEELLIVVQIETETAIKNLDGILAVKGIDVALIGPYDLSMNLGVFTQWENPRFKAAVNRVLEACEKWKVTPGFVCGDENVKEAVDRGFKFLSVGGDEGFMIKGALDSLRKAKEAAGIK
ncbi:MAG: aldolase/citrate lyase family protein [Candidatus Bathyarchaeia archaeon]